MYNDRATAYQRGYDRRWQKVRDAWLRDHPLCVYCERFGKLSAATVVDHIIPHRGDYKLFTDADNLQSLCKHCHDSHKQRLEKSGKVLGCDVQGNPIDEKHHWNQ